MKNLFKSLLLSLSLLVAGCGEEVIRVGLEDFSPLDAQVSPGEDLDSPDGSVFPDASVIQNPLLCVVTSVLGEDDCLSQEFRWEAGQCVTNVAFESDCDQINEGGATDTQCTDECTENETVCVGNDLIMTCVKALDGCTTLVPIQNCQGDEACVMVGDEARCQAQCTENCTLGQKKCLSNKSGVLECVSQNGCNEWIQVIECNSDQACDDGSLACESTNTCRNVCTAGAKQCSGQTVQKCTVGANGCTSWVNDTTCSGAMHCASGACAYNCGDPNGADCEKFSIVILPDTQNYTRVSSLSSSYYKNQMNWIVKNKNTSKMPNLKLVVHMGDITNDNTDAQWKIAKGAQDILKDAKVPFTVVTGNHDYRKKNSSGKDTAGGRSRSKFTEYFPKSYLEGIVNYAGADSSGFNTYYTFKGGGQEYLVLNLEYAPRQSTLCWANKLLQKPENQKRKVIMSSHGIISHNAKYVGKPSLKFVPHGARGEETWNMFTSRHSNIIMTLSGHVGDSERKVSTGHNKNIVQEILTDYQFEKPCDKSKVDNCTDHCAHVANAGNGWLRVLIFDPKTNTIQSNIYSAVTGNKSVFSQNPKDQFYCSALYKGSNSSYDNWYHRDPANKEHVYSFNYDFTSNHTYKYNDNGDRRFVHRTLNSTGSGQQVKSRVAANNTGAFVVVWEEKTSDTATEQVRAHLYDAGGCDRSSGQTKDFQVNVAQTGTHTEPDVAMDDQGNFVVVWTDDSDSNGSLQLRMRGFYADGSERFAPKTVNSVSKGDQYQGKIAMASDGRFAVSWTDTREGKETPQIMVRGFKADGSEAFAERPIADTVAGTRVKSAIYMDNSKRLVVAWEDDEDGNGSTQTRMRLLADNGTNRTKVITVNSVSTGNQNAPAISGTQNGSKFIVTWQNVASGTYSIMGRVFDGNGTPQKEMTFSKTGKSMSGVDVCMNNSGAADVVWYESKSNTSGSCGTNVSKNVMRRVMKSDYSLSGSNESVVNSPDNKSSEFCGSSKQPAIACIPGGKASIKTYSDDNDGNGYDEIFGVGQNL